VPCPDGYPDGVEGLVFVLGEVSGEPGTYLREQETGVSGVSINLERDSLTVRVGCDGGVRAGRGVSEQVPVIR
jgi:hypothetical protein